jgi:hypothetical protein
MGLFVFTRTANIKNLPSKIILLVEKKDKGKIMKA